VELHGVALEPTNLEAPLDDLAPAEHHLPVIGRQPRASLCDEALDDGAARRRTGVAARSGRW